MTFSIVARDQETGELGVATATGGPVVGSLVPHAGAGCGAIATQGYTNPLYGPDGMAALARGQSAATVVDELTSLDPQRDKRQFIVVDARGGTGGWTGSALTQFHGMILEENLAVAGNLLADRAVIKAMSEAFKGHGDAPMAVRLLEALAAGEAAGGDARGTRSAAILTYLDQPYPRYDMRIDLSPHPIGDLRALLTVVNDADYADFYAELPRRN